MRHFGDKPKNKIMRAKAQSGQHHTNVDMLGFMMFPNNATKGFSEILFKVYSSISH